MALQFNANNKWFFFIDKLISISNELLIRNDTNINGNIKVNNHPAINFTGLNGQKFNSYWTTSQNHKSAYNFGHSDWTSDTFFRDAPPVGIIRRFNAINFSTNENQIAYRWCGWIIPEISESYYFKLTSNGYNQLYINGSLLVNHNGTLGTPTENNISLVKDIPYFIEIVFSANNGSTNIKLEYKIAASGNYQTSLTSLFRCENY